MDLTQAVYDRMAGDPGLTGLLATYGGEPAIFTAEPVPLDATLPYIVTTGQVSGAVDVPEASKQRIGARVIRDLRIYDQTNGDISRAEAIADRVWELFHRQPLLVTGWDSVLQNATLPILTQADGYFYGLVVTVTLAAVKQ